VNINKSELRYNSFEDAKIKRLYKDICCLMCGGYRKELKKLGLNLLTDDVTIYFYMFRSFVEDGIQSNVTADWLSQ